MNTLNSNNFNNYSSSDNEDDDGDDEELMAKAFDINDKIKPPQNYVLDSMNDDSIKFLKKVQEQYKDLEKNNKMNVKKLNNNNLVNTKESNEPSYKKVQLVDLNFKKEYIENILTEFQNLRNCIEDYKKNFQGSYKSYDDFLKSNYLDIENIEYFGEPSVESSTLLNNMISIRILKYFKKLLTLEKNTYTILLWVYYILSNLQCPLTDDQSSVLHDINKIIYRQLNKLEAVTNYDETAEYTKISLKIVFTILSKYFEQNLII